MPADGRYRSQWATWISNGGRSAVDGGDRRRWERDLFDGHYDDAPDDLERPVYGAFDLLEDPHGGSPRFGSSVLVLAPSASGRVSGDRSRWAAPHGSAKMGPTREHAMGGSTEEQNVAVIRSFIEAWSRLDPDELAGYFAEDGCYHNIPVGPVTGRTEVRDMIAGFTAGWTETTWELLNVAASGDVVFTERIDRTTAGERAVDLPCAGVFTLEDGKIKVWRDYFDLATFTNGMAGER